MRRRRPAGARGPCGTCSACRAFWPSMPAHRVGTEASWAGRAARRHPTIRRRLSRNSSRVIGPRHCPASSRIRRCPASAGPAEAGTASRCHCSNLLCPERNPAATGDLVSAVRRAQFVVQVDMRQPADGRSGTAGKADTCALADRAAPAVRTDQVGGSRGVRALGATSRSPRPRPRLRLAPPAHGPTERRRRVRAPASRAGEPIAAAAATAGTSDCPRHRGNSDPDRRNVHP